MKKRMICIDAGAHVGQSIDRLREKFKGKNITIYSFEPHPRCFLEAKTRADATTFVENKAVWVRDELIDFYCDTLDLYSHRIHPGEGSTMFETRTMTQALPNQFDSCGKITADAFDFSQWIKNTFEKEDFIHLKMDIEGAEYQVLEKMIEDGTMEYINELDVEFHWNFIGLDERIHNILIEKLATVNCSISYHD